MKHDQHGLIIRITQLSEGTHNYHFTIHATELGLAENFRENVEIDVVLEKTQRQFYLKIKAGTSAEYLCDRCAESLVSGVDAYIELCYAFDESAQEISPEEELRLIHPGTPYIDITDDVRQIITLAVPLKVVCNEECKGLCPHCGKNLNNTTCTCTDEPMDSRWDELRKLKVENNQ